MLGGLVLPAALSKAVADPFAEALHLLEKRLGLGGLLGWVLVLIPDWDQVPDVEEVVPPRDGPPILQTPQVGFSILVDAEDLQ